MGENIRVLIAKVGQDGHTRGATRIITCLRDAGMEVIPTPLHQTPEQVVNTAMQEDVDLIGASFLDGSHMYPLTKIVELLREKGMTDVILIAGGLIPDSDTGELKRRGVDAIFTARTPLEKIVEFIRNNAADRRKQH